MSIPLFCNCNRHFSFITPIPKTTLLSPLSSQFPNCPYQSLPFKPLRRRTSLSAAAPPDTQTLPQSAIQRIAEKLRSLGYVEETITKSPDENLPNSPGEIFVPLPAHLPKYRVGHTLDPSWSTPENPVPEPGSGNAIRRFHDLRRGVLEERERVRKCNEGKRKSAAPSLAELTLPGEELRRLRSVGIGLKKKLKIGKAGITEGIVNGIHERWRRTELVKIACEDVCRLNMKRTHELLERKTGGRVIWRSGSNIVLYRGSNYKYPYFFTDTSPNDSSSEDSPDTDKDQRMESKMGLNSDTQISHPPLMKGVGLPNRVRFQLPGEIQLADEADALLEGLGPRFSDWWGYDPLPVDADLLPAVVPGYKKPFRLLPYGVKPKLTNDEMTILKRLGRPLPCHFALGRNRKLQGLAAAIVKLWEKCEIAKIAVKRGVQNTNSELMAEELKWLTGGTLLSRDKEFIVFYRGKDFLPAAVSSAIEERRKYGVNLQKSRTQELPILIEKEDKEYAGVTEHDKEKDQILRGRFEERKLRLSEAATERTNTKLSMALEKKARAEKLLAELEKEEIPQPPPMDKEGITEEERYMLRKVGLRMKAFLLLGRRGVFDGTVENMHLHWKYRELVKVCIGKRSIEEVHGVARTLEAESGGILVAVEPASKGYAIIVYRGKNYTRPASLRPKTLLSKREAMKRSLEAQRRESLKLHVLKLSKNIDELKLTMAKDEDINDPQLEEDSQVRFVEQEINETHRNHEKISHADAESNSQFHPANKTREEIDATSKDTEDPMHTSKGSAQIVRQDSPRDVSLQSEVKGNYLFDTTEAELQPRLIPKETKCFPKRSGNGEGSYSLRPHRGSRESNVGGYQNAKLEYSVEKSIKERPSVVPFRASQLSNKERLLLRKQALKMKKLPILAIGKSNVVSGVAKAIKAHFQKHPLAIVNIKGRAKGTSVQDVIYNLEQATGAVLVSQEPSKVILYRGWGSTAESDRDSGNVNKESKDELAGDVSRPIISRELISAMRLECGLKSVDKECAEATTDGSIDGLPNDN